MLSDLPPPRSLTAAAVLVALLGCGPTPMVPTAAPPPAAAPWFEDVTGKVGLDFVHDAGPAITFAMTEVLGSGAALFDADGDGRLDIYLLQNGGPKGAKSRLYLQKPDGTFRDASAGSGLDIAGLNMGVAIGDVDGDGRPDVVVTQYLGLRLFLNRGGGQFEDVTEGSGLKNAAWNTSAAFLDYDRDGRLDLVVASYVDYDPTFRCTSPSGVADYCAPRVFQGRVARLFHNLGSGKFADVTLPSGLGRLPSPGLGVLCYDFDGDGWPDVFIANDGAPNHLWINQRDGTFREEAVSRGVATNAMAKPEASMGVALHDADGDGLPDLFVTHLTEETNTLWVQGPRGRFRDKTVRLGLSGPRWRGTGFGAAFADFDNDGWPDVAVANGRVSRTAVNAFPDLGPHWGCYAERNQVFKNVGGGRFEDRSPDEVALCGKPNVARGLVAGDIDNDGGLDLLVTTVAGRARLFRNVAPNRGHWLRVRALDASGKRDAYGAEVRALVGTGERLGWVNPGQSYLCSGDPRVHLGLGESDKMEGVCVLWPDGTREVFAVAAVDREVTLRQGTGKAEAARP